jgi:16S rRNA U516 pseudouridylate synthase RsuA-like enzyme
MKSDIEQLQNGVIIEGKRTKRAKVKVLTREPKLPSASCANPYQKKHSNNVDRNQPP